MAGIKRHSSRGGEVDVELGIDGGAGLVDSLSGCKGTGKK